MPQPTEIVERLRAAGCVFAEDEAAVLVASASDADQLESYVRERVAGTPLEHVVGWVDFCGVRVAIEPGVFVPRPRTGALVDRARGQLRAGSLLVDVCCGCGAVGAALAAAVAGIRILAVDSDERAASVARRNLAGVDAQVFRGDLFEPLPERYRGAVDIVTAVAPYVPTGELGLLPREARDFEPRAALDGGRDGLAVIERIIADAPLWLAPGGIFVTETGDRQADRVAALMTASGLVSEVERNEDAGTTVVVGRAPRG